MGRAPFPSRAPGGALQGRRDGSQAADSRRRSSMGKSIPIAGRTRPSCFSFQTAASVTAGGARSRPAPWGVGGIGSSFLCLSFFCLSILCYSLFSCVRFPTRGKSTCGKSTCGKSTCGKPTRGKSTCGKSTCGFSADGCGGFWRGGFRCRIQAYRRRRKSQSVRPGRGSSLPAAGTQAWPPPAPG